MPPPKSRAFGVRAPEPLRLSESSPRHLQGDFEKNVLLVLGGAAVLALGFAVVDNGASWCHVLIFVPEQTHTPAAPRDLRPLMGSSTPVVLVTPFRTALAVPSVGSCRGPFIQKKRFRFRACEAQRARGDICICR